jgi:hypothetical protein
MFIGGWVGVNQFFYTPPSGIGGGNIAPDFSLFGHVLGCVVVGGLAGGVSVFILAMCIMKRRPSRGHPE